jgi:hypothetical protein
LAEKKQETKQEAETETAGMKYLKNVADHIRRDAIRNTKIRQQFQHF